MRLYAIIAATVSLAAVPALPQTASAQEVIVTPPPGYGVTVIQPYAAAPPPGVVVRPAPPPAAHYYGTPGYEAPGVYAGYRSVSCDWLHTRALDTGSSYWWSRYEACAD